MKIIYDRYTIKLIPENEQDVAFIEDTMGLCGDGDTIDLERIESEDVEYGFRLETDLKSGPVHKHNLPPHPSYKMKPNGLYERPLEDFIDFCDSDNIEAVQGKGGTKKLD
tara:strand:+ start:1777 stop:2106 length:330 start_codon:yes stop_codon:yes gene_type:complete